MNDFAAEQNEQRDAEQHGIRLLADREHSRLELRRKLLARDYDPGIVEEVLRSLEKQGLLSDERFTEQYINVLKRKGFGPLRMRALLRERGINDTMISERVDHREDEWRQLMIQTARRKFGDSKGEDFREKSKIARYLEYRGYPEYLIRDYLFD
ncbi:MAG: regulatory protein RecX [Sedimenticolaceae bacterium]|nr:regulatory protein RecX [Sedimenticolaceae bacterium]